MIKIIALVTAGMMVTPIQMEALTYDMSGKHCKDFKKEDDCKKTCPSSKNPRVCKWDGTKCYRGNTSC